MSQLNFRARLADCRCCPRNCGADRLSGKNGVCRLDADIHMAHSCLHFGEEPPISGTRGSGAIFFSHCNLRCVFCQNFQISQPFEAHTSATHSVEQLAYRMLELQAQGAHNINFVSPSHVVFQMADAITLARSQGLTVPIVYNSNGYDSVDTLKMIDGLIDIYLPDFKYLEEEAARHYSKAADYPLVIPGVLQEMFRQVGPLVCNEEDIASRGMLIRHLVLPGHIDNSRRILRYIADHLPTVPLSIMAQYSPQYNAGHYARINRILTTEEYDSIVDYALNLGMENAFIQDALSSETCLPDFDSEQAFDFNRCVNESI